MNSFLSFAPLMTEIIDNKTRIALEALQLFIQFGIRSVSMDELAAELGMSKKTLYNYYKDKDEIVLAVVTMVLDKNCKECRADKQNAKNAIHESFMAIDQTTELFSRMNPTLMFELKKYHPRAYRVFEDYKSNFLYETLKNNISWGIDEGLFRDDIQVELTVRYRLETVLLAFTPEIYIHADAGIGKTHEQLFYIFLYGIATPKGHQMINKYRKERLKNNTDAKN